MKALICALLLGAVYCHAANAENIPFNPIPAQKYGMENNTSNYARLKISVAADDVAKVPQLRYGTVVVCSKTECYRPLVAETGGGSGNGEAATLLADILVPPVRIEKIYVEGVKGGNFEGTIKLANPLIIEPGFHGGEILMVVKPTRSGGALNYRPEFVTSNPLRENGRSIYYNPKFPLTANLDFGIILEIPAGALLKPQIFNVQINDTGNAFPLIDIYPSITLGKNALISVSAIPRVSGNRNSSLGLTTKVPPPFSPNGQPLSRKIASAEIGMGAVFPVKKKITKTGILRSFDFQDSESSAGEQSAVLREGVGTSAAAELTCNDYLSYPPNMEIIRNTSAQVGYSYIDWCVNIPPYVHMMHINKYDRRVRFSVPRFTANRAGTGTPGYQLSRLGVLAPGNGIAINGFYWSGDEGTGPYQWGVAQGYLMADGLVGGANRQGGGTTGGTGLSDGNKLIMVGFADFAIDHQWVETSTVNYAFPNARFQISSSTSILKYGQCSGDTEYNAFSAVGAGPGVMVFMSSASATSTNAAELCPLFRSFGTVGALRLDGGPSAGMTKDGVLLNPLTGFYSLRYGFSRYIAYGLRMSW